MKPGLSDFENVALVVGELVVLTVAGLVLFLALAALFIRVLDWLWWRRHRKWVKR